jgi:twitching motility protein PilT
MLLRAIEVGASDVHLKNGQPPILRKDGAMRRLESWPVVTSDALEHVLREVTAVAPAKLEAFVDTGDLDIAYVSESLPRFRVNAYRQRGEISFAFRTIPSRIPSLPELTMPPGVEKLANWQRGLILVTGATGAGKSTTLAAMVDHINRTRHQHIVTIEDPIEFLHEDLGCIVNQREVELDTRSYMYGLRQAMRQDPDVILIGELRDTEAAETALQAAESGHLVLSTMHTVDAPEAVARMVEFFPEEKQTQIRSILAANLRGVISQRLLPRIGGGRVAAVEVMVSNNRIADLIREDRLEEILVAIAEGSFFEMRTFTQALIELVLTRQVDREVAADASTNRHDFLLSLDYAVRMRNARLEASESGEAAIEDEFGSRAEVGRPLGTPTLRVVERKP